MTRPTPHIAASESRMPADQRINRDLLRPLTQTSWLFYLLVAVFGGIVLAALVAWLSQVTRGFGITGIRWPIYWGFYVTSFVFWIGISHAGTLISALLRLVNAGWRGTPKQWHRLETAMQIMAVAIIPVAVSVHTIVSFDFSMAPVPMWQTTIFGPYFVAGAIFSGIAALLIAMAVLRRFLHLENYLHRVHFENLGKLLLVMALLWGYFVFNERLVTYYGNKPAEMAVFWRTQRESFAPLYWTMVTGNFILPLILMGIRRFRTITGCVIASVGVVIGMWLERFLIIVPALGHKYLPYSFGVYRPQPVEILIAGATFAAMALLYVLFAKVVPIISIWELKAGAHVPSTLIPPATQEHPLGELHL